MLERSLTELQKYRVWQKKHLIYILYLKTGLTGLEGGRTDPCHP